jgi:hypothetical protein
VSEVVLGPHERIAGKRFSDPVHTRRDEEALRKLLAHERERARVWAADPLARSTSVVIDETDDDGHRHLLVVPDTQALLEARSPTVVGFFGRPRADADHATLFTLEDELVESMGAYARDGLLSYYDVELVKGRYGNLILFATPDGPSKWRENDVHRRAVEISPRNYQEIRLHRGTLAGRLLEAGALRVTLTKYLDYSDAEVWRAVRTVSGSTSQR